MAIATELPVDTTATATEMAQEMFGNGITLVSATYTGASGAAGIYSGGAAVAPGITPSDTGLILSTGNATDITNSSGTADTNISAGTSTDHNTAGDADLNTISGQTTFDAAVIEADFIPDGSTLTMQFVFSSEEYLEYVNSGFNDAVGVWVNGVEASLSVGSGHVSIDEINNTANSNLYVDNVASADTYNTEMDGFTVTLTLKAPVNPGVVNTIKIGIADGGDTSYDSNLLIAGNSVQTSLIAGDDEITVHLGQDPAEIDLISNDSSSMSPQMTITHINGQPVSIGDQVTLGTGEVIELTAAGFVMVSPNTTEGENFFTYTVEDGAGNTDVGFVKLTTTPCFCAGTRILTPTGERAVETLRPGDRVVTLDHGPRPLIWVGHSVRPVRGRDAPVEIMAGHMGARRATRLSPQHRVLLRDGVAEMLFGAIGGEVLVQAQDLIDGHRVKRPDRGGAVTYVHLLFASHEIVFANGVATESYLPGPQTQNGFDTNSSRALMQMLRARGLGRMCSARQCLKPHEASVLLGKSTPSRIAPDTGLPPPAPRPHADPVIGPL